MTQAAAIGAPLRQNTRSLRSGESNFTAASSAERLPRARQLLSYVWHVRTATVLWAYKTFRDKHDGCIKVVLKP